MCDLFRLQTLQQDQQTFKCTEGSWTLVWTAENSRDKKKQEQKSNTLLNKPVTCSDLQKSDQ